MSVVICGAGIAGVATAFHLSVEHGLADVVVCDPRPPLTLTSDKSTECYRNWWPNRNMVGFMNRSIDILEELDRRSEGAFHLNRRGYLYVTASPERLAAMEAEADAVVGHGAGPLRRFPPEPGGPDGADLLDRRTLVARYPSLTGEAVGGLLVHRAGWMSAQQLGAWMLERAIDAGVRLLPHAVVAVEVDDEAVAAVGLSDGSTLPTGFFVDAAGPMVGPVAELVGVALPMLSEAHHKVAFRDHLGVVERSAPMLIWCDDQQIPWSPEEAGMLVEAGRPELTATMPPFCHGRPEGGDGSDWVLALWEHTRTVMEPAWPMPHDELYPEVVMRGMATMLPGLTAYLDRLPQPFVDGGYYTKAPDNLPVVGPIGPNGFHVCGGLSGYGVMAAPAAGELAAQHILNHDLPTWAEAFSPTRFDDPAYLASIESSDAGQL
ncbi:MAG: NAD(P)/FAD-dependent oxidoreductase [Acidimicrobiia bacterium]